MKKYLKQSKALLTAVFNRRLMCISILILIIWNTFVILLPDDDYCTLKECSNIIITGYIKDRIKTGDSYKYILDYGGFYSDACIYDDHKELIPVGSKLQVKGIKKEFNIAKNKGQFDQKKYYNSLNLSFLIDKPEIQILDARSNFIDKLRKAREEIVKKTREYMQDNTGVLISIILGDKTYLEEDLKTQYQRSGIGHILAISGLHVSCVSMILYSFLKRIRINKYISFMLVIIFLIIYSLFTGLSTSIVRALCMFSASVLSGLKGRRYDMPTIAGVSLLIFSFFYPKGIFSSSTILSYSAVISIYTYNRISDKCNSLRHKEKSTRKIYNRIIKPLDMGIFISLLTFPIILFYFYTYPLYSFLLNIVVISSMTVFFMIGMIGVAFVFLIPSISQILFKLASIMISVYNYLSEISMKIPGGVLVIGKPSIWKIAVYYVILSLVLYLVINFKKKRVLIVFLMIIPVSILIYKPPEYYWNMIDVDQGECSIIKSGKNVIMIDCGSSGKSEIYRYVVEPYLLSEGISRIDACFLSHSDLDHINGIEEMLKMKNSTIRYNNIFITKTMKSDESVKKNIIKPALQNKINIISSYEDMNIDFKSMRIHVIKSDCRNDSNDSSMVLQIKIKNKYLLFTGDISSIIEDEIKTVKCDFLKISHHGSATSSSDAFLKKTSPLYALISCGEDNPYGHPSIDVLTRLKKRKINYLMTSRSGQIKTYLENKTVRIIPFLCPD